MRFQWATHLLVELSWLLVSIGLVLGFHWVFLGLDPYFLLYHLNGSSAVDVPLIDYYVVLPAYFFLFFLTVGVSAWLYVIRASYARLRNRRVNLLLKIVIVAHVLQFVYVVVHAYRIFSNLQDGGWSGFAILGICIAFWTGVLYFLWKRTRALDGNSVDWSENRTGSNSSNTSNPMPSQFFRLQIEMGWLLIYLVSAYSLFVLSGAKPDLVGGMRYVRVSNYGSTWINFNHSYGYFDYLLMVASACFVLRSLWHRLDDRLLNILTIIMMLFNILSIGGTVFFLTLSESMVKWQGGFGLKVEVVWAVAFLLLALYAVWIARYWRKHHPQAPIEEHIE